jgi:hypothetical protein
MKSAQRYVGPTPHSVGAEEGPGQARRKENLALFFLAFKIKYLVSDWKAGGSEVPVPGDLHGAGSARLYWKVSRTTDP